MVPFLFPSTWPTTVLLNHWALQLKIEGQAFAGPCGFQSLCSTSSRGISSLSFGSNRSKGITSFIEQMMTVGKEGRWDLLPAVDGVCRGLPCKPAPVPVSTDFKVRRRDMDLFQNFTTVINMQRRMSTPTQHTRMYANQHNAEALSAVWVIM